MFAANAGHLDEAIEAALELQALAQDLGDILGESAALAFLGYIAVAKGNYHRADTLARRAIEIQAGASAEHDAFKPVQGFEIDVLASLDRRERKLP